VKIDLNEYGRELGYWIEGFKPFVDQASHAALDRLKRELEDSRDNRRSAFDWKLAKPVMTIATDRYDGKNKTPHKVRIGWQFESRISLTDNSRRSPVWTIDRLSTHVRVYSTTDDQIILHYHHDLREKSQLGPQSHMQFSERFRKDKGLIPIAVPRFPSLAVLPTDCLDLALCEFFPFKWPQEQAGVTGLTVLQNRQRNRLLEMAKVVVDAWDKKAKTPLAVIQDLYKPDLKIA
jgi:hypothetical protein